MAKSIAILSIARKYLDTKTMIQLYYSFVFPYLHYCNLAWGNASDTTLWPVFRSQKIALRIISNTPRKSSTVNFCKTNLILRLPDIYKNSMGLFMFKLKKNLLPNIFENCFSQNDRFHSFPTRHASQLRPPRIKTQIGSNFIKTTGVNFWNILENTITSNRKIGSFKTHLRKYIINTT
jgi:hypothetical protein